MSVIMMMLIVALLVFSTTTAIQIQNIADTNSGADSASREVHSADENNGYFSHLRGAARRLQGSFNIYKSYANVAPKLRPPQYSKNKNLRPLSPHKPIEYLSGTQKMMMKQRNSPTTEANSFDNKWSGFNLKENGINVPLNAPNAVAKSGK